MICKVIQSKQLLSDSHYKCFIRQLLEVKTMHAMDIFHRDLKPGNILAVIANYASQTLGWLDTCIVRHGGRMNRTP